MFEVRESDEFRSWYAELEDGGARKRIGTRIARLGAGLIGDWKPVSGPVSELRIDYGPGYRVYFMRAGRIVVILLCAGTKGSQRRDIERAKKIAARIRT